MAVSIMNDVKAATLAELTWGALRGVPHGVYFNLGTGIAAGIVASGQSSRAPTGRPERSVTSSLEWRLSGGPASGTAREDMAPPLELLVGGLAVPGRARRRLGLELSMEQLSERSHDDEKAAALLDDILTEIALWIANVATVLDPGRVVIGGGSSVRPGPVRPDPRGVRQGLSVPSGGPARALRSRLVARRCGRLGAAAMARDRGLVGRQTKSTWGPAS